MKKTITFISIVVVASLIAISCKKKTTTTTPATTSTTGTSTPPVVSISSTPQVSYNLAGTNYTYVSGSAIEAASGASGSASSTPGVNGSKIYSADLDNGSNITYLNINWGTLSFPFGSVIPDTATFRHFFTLGSKLYSPGGVNGVEVSTYDASGTAWSTSLGAGTQTSSTFSVVAVQQQYLLGPSGDQYMKFMAKFSCTLYNSSGGSKSLTNGVFVGYFENM